MWPFKKKHRRPTLQEKLQKMLHMTKQIVMFLGAIGEGLRRGTQQGQTTIEAFKKLEKVFKKDRPPPYTPSSDDLWN